MNVFRNIVTFSFQPNIATTAMKPNFQACHDDRPLIDYLNNPVSLSERASCKSNFSTPGGYTFTGSAEIGAYY